MSVDPSGIRYLADVQHRLVQSGFTCTAPARVDLPNVQSWPAEGNRELVGQIGMEGFPLAARRTRFELTKFGMVEYFFVFRTWPSISLSDYATFAGLAQIYAARNKTVPLPHGLFESVVCFPVAVVDRIDTNVAEHIRKTAPLAFGEIEHFWVPVMYELATNALVTYEKTPAWGAAYYAGFRRIAGQIVPNPAVDRPATATS